MGFLVWKGLRQIQGTMDSVSWLYGEHQYATAIEKGPFSFASPASEVEIRKYNELLSKSLLSQYSVEPDQMQVRYNVSVSNLYAVYQKDFFKESFETELKARHLNIGDWSKEIVPDDYAYKITAGAAAFTNVEYQINCLGFIRLFGSYEQFEIDLLKLLFHYRPNGKAMYPYSDVDPDFQEDVDPRIVLEKPKIENNKEIFTYPPLWTWIKPYTNGNDERRKILKNVFDVSIVPAGYDNKLIKKWQDDRNAIAHGKHLVDISLKDVFDFSIFCKRLVLQAETVCSEKFNLRI